MTLGPFFFAMVPPLGPGIARQIAFPACTAKPDSIPERSSEEPPSLEVSGGLSRRKSLAALLALAKPPPRTPAKNGKTAPREDRGS